GLVIGEMLVLRLENGTGVPLSYAVLLVLASSFHAPECAAVVVGAEIISAVLRKSARSSGWRIRIIVERIVVAAATVAVYDAVRASLARRVVRIRATRLGDARVPADDRGLGHGAGVRRHRAHRSLATSGGAVVRDGGRARGLGQGHLGSRDGRAVAPSRPGHD